MCYDFLNHETSYMFLPLHASVFLFSNPFRKIFKRLKIKIALQFSATSRGGAKSPETVWNFEKLLENFRLGGEAGAWVGEVAVVCSTQSILFPGWDLSLQEFLFLFSPVCESNCAVSLGEAGKCLSSGNGEGGERSGGKHLRCQCFSFAHNLESESKREGSLFPRCQELSGVPRPGQVWRVGTISLITVAGPEFLPGPGEPTPHPPFRTRPTVTCPFPLPRSLFPELIMEGACSPQVWGPWLGVKASCSRLKFRLQIGKVRLEPSALGGCSGSAFSWAQGMKTLEAKTSQITHTELLAEPRRVLWEALVWDPSPFFLPSVQGPSSPLEAH